MRIILARPGDTDLYAVRKMARAYRVPVSTAHIFTPNPLHLNRRKIYALEVTPEATPLSTFEWTRENLDANFVIGPTVGSIPPNELDLMDGVIQVEQPAGTGFLSTVGVASILLYQAHMARLGVGV